MRTAVFLPPNLPEPVNWLNSYQDTDMLMHQIARIDYFLKGLFREPDPRLSWGARLGNSLDRARPRIAKRHAR